MGIQAQPASGTDAQGAVSPEQIIAHLRVAEVLLTKGLPTGEFCRHRGVSKQTYCRWRKECGDLEVDHVCVELSVAESRACRVLGQPRSTQRYRPRVVGDEAALTARIVALAQDYGRYGYRWTTALVRGDAW